MIPAPPKLEDLRAGTMLRAGLGTSVVIADFDFETYSPAGFVWDPVASKWGSLPNATHKGLPVVGVVVYTEHPDAEVLCLAYDLKDTRGRRQWTPGCSPPPEDLFDHILRGQPLEAWNCSFEYWVWKNICVPKYGFPELPLSQLRDAAAKARAFALPGSLGNCAEVLKLTQQKDKEGKRLIQKFCVPRNPTKDDPRLRIPMTLPLGIPQLMNLLSEPLRDVDDSLKMYAYNLQDIATEAEASSLIPDLSPDELEFWKCDQAINARGVAVDTAAIKNCIQIIEQAHAKYNAELYAITGGAVRAASEIAKLSTWIKSYGITLRTLDADAIDEMLSWEHLPEAVRRALEIRSTIGSAAVKKLYAMINQVSRHGRLHNLFIYHSARTGRAAGAGPQPQNLPNSGPDTVRCVRCRKQYGEINEDINCPWCGVEAYIGQNDILEWNVEAVEDALRTISSVNLECVEMFWDDAVSLVSACLRGLFIAAPGHDLICSDYSAIEAVVLAALAGEEWRMDVFNTHGKIYEMSASKITGIPFEEFERHKIETGQHHPMRKKVGKVAELASGFQGWIGAWKQFGADEFFSENEIKLAILEWRKASPKIVEMWGGQERNWQAEMYGLEGMAISAVLNPGTEYSYRGITYKMSGDALYCRLLSGRYITYHRPRLAANNPPRRGLQLTFEGWNTNPKHGGIGWVRMSTYGGKLTENVVQATARDILAHAIVNLENAGYPVVLHVHDEIACEVKEGQGSIEEFERIMNTMPLWAQGWPIKASGGWRGKRYRK